LSSASDAGKSVGLGDWWNWIVLIQAANRRVIGYNVFGGATWWTRGALVAPSGGKF